MAIIPYFRCSKILGEAGKQEIYNKRSENSRSQIVSFRTDIFRKFTLGAPDTVELPLTATSWLQRLLFFSFRRTKNPYIHSCFNLSTIATSLQWPLSFRPQGGRCRDVQLESLAHVTLERTSCENIRVL